jgi:hypothetical protein|tara:strand:- start:331 stop:438 length:108 start_codon:yes stop_codon:yes gene_type:complete
VGKADKNFEFEEICDYTTSKGDKGWILKVVPKKKD